MKETRSFLEESEDRAYILFLLKECLVQGNIKMMKLIFLTNYYYAKENNDLIFHYTFIRWHYGPYSNSIQNDINSLITSGLVQKGENNTYSLTEKGGEILGSLQTNLSSKKLEFIKGAINRLSSKSTNELLELVHNLDELKSIKFGEHIQ